MTFSPDEALDALSAHPASTVLCCDFDGTLAPIVSDPELATAAAGSLDALVRLARHLQRVAVISGRPLEFLERRLGPDVVRSLDLFGRYGAEHAAGGTSDSAPPERASSTLLRAQLDAAAAEASVRLPEIRIEDKGGSIALHWRERPDLEMAARAIADELALAFGLEVRAGKMVVDLVEFGAPSKGAALGGLLLDANCGGYFGDDLGDLDAFDALDRFEERGGRSVRVAVASNEAPDELLEHADLILPTPVAVAEFLVALAGRFEA